MAIINVASLNRGINLQQDPSAIPDGFVVDAVGFDMVPEGRIDTANGINTSLLGAYLPAGKIQWADIYYIETTRYVMATTSSGLYANGKLVNNEFVGRFKGCSFTNNIYLVNGNHAIRFDGTHTWRWGISHPTYNPWIYEAAGSSSLHGDYYFLYTFVRTDSYGNTVAESSPTRVDFQLQIIGPVHFNGGGIGYANRQLSIDPQVTSANLYAIGGNIADWSLIGSFGNNTQKNGTLNGIGEDTTSTIMNCWENYPAPAGQDVVLFWNKIWMVGAGDAPNVLRTSDVLSDGTLAPEAWPAKNGYELDGNNGKLLNIDILGGKISIKGEFGEWQVTTTDPTDYLQTRSVQVSTNGLASQDAIIRLPSSHIYPSKRGFVETNGTTAQFIMPELMPLIDTYIENSLGVNAGLVSYFTYKTIAFGKRTAKVDLFSGKVRFTNLNDVLFDQMFYDKKSGIAYGVLNGQIGVIDSGVTNEFVPGKELTAYIRSKTFQLPSTVSWTAVSFRHNTQGLWFILNIYVDDVIVESFPFQSESTKLDYFRFGPFSGSTFYFEIKAGYTKKCQIYLPIRIYHSGK